MFQRRARTTLIIAVTREPRIYRQAMQGSGLCAMCPWKGKAYPLYPLAVREHFKRRHPSVCRKCLEKFDSAAALDNHTSIVHGGANKQEEIKGGLTEVTRLVDRLVKHACEEVDCLFCLGSDIIEKATPALKKKIEVSSRHGVFVFGASRENHVAVNTVKLAVQRLDMCWRDREGPSIRLTKYIARDKIIFCRNYATIDPSREIFATAIIALVPMP